MIRVKEKDGFFQMSNTKDLNYDIYFTKGRKQKKYLNYSSNNQDQSQKKDKNYSE